jgi:hypothetical protein
MSSLWEEARRYKQFVLLYNDFPAELFIPQIEQPYGTSM